MDLMQLKADHPAIYAKAVQDGIDKERDRVCAHLILGKTYGAMEQAVKAVKDGEEMTHTCQANYLAAGKNTQDINAREQDNPDDDIDTAKEPEAGDEDAVLALVESKLGIEGGK